MFIGRVRVSWFLFLRLQPVSGFHSLSCKSGLCIFIYLCLLVCSVLSLYSLSQYQSYLVYCLWSIVFWCYILDLTFWFRPYFRVLANYSLAFCFCSSAYRIIWITTSACLLNLLLPCPIKSVFSGTLCVWVLFHLHSLHKNVTVSVCYNVCLNLNT